MPAKKRPDNRQGRGTTDLATSAPPAKAPPPPHVHHSGKSRPMLKMHRDSWAEFWATELASLVQPGDHRALTRLWQLYDLRERMQRAALAQPFATGSTGQIVTHPALKEMASLDGRIQALEDRFGLTPKARLQLGVTLGNAAKSLDDMNRQFAEEVDDDRYADPRGNVIDING